MNAVALDTMVLIWGLRQARRSARADLERRARILLRLLEEQKATIIVPSVVAAELLVPVPQDKRAEFIAELSRRFMCCSLDLQAAAKAAELWQKHRQLPKPDQLKRTTLKSDALIVASAFVAGAKTFYSHDPKCRRLAELAGMESNDLPTHHENMFIDKEMRGGEEP